MARQRPAVGFSIHTGWAVAVVLSGPRPKLLWRQRVELSKDNTRFAYHMAADAPDKAEQFIGKTEKLAREMAYGFFESLAKELPAAKLTVALPRAKKVLPSLEKILKAHPLLHTAEGELFRMAIAAAAEKAGHEVKVVEPEEPKGLGEVGRPWNRDHRLAAALAYAALRD